MASNGTGSGVPGRSPMARQLQERMRFMEEAKAMQNRLGIKWDELPDYPFFAFPSPLAEQARRHIVVASILETSRKVGRPLTQPETDALAYHTSKRVVTKSYGDPVTIGLTGYLLARGRAILRFPFWTPPQRFTPASRRGRFLMHGFRILAYLIPVSLGVEIATMSYANNVFKANINLDDRLAGLRQVSRQGHPGADQGGSVPAFDDDSASDSAASWGDSQNGSAQPFEPDAPATYQDGSPTSSGSSWAKPEAPARQGPSANNFPFGFQRPPALPNQQSSQRTSQKGEDAWSAVDEDSSVFDDASPVAPSYRNSSSTQSSSNSGRGSAWDRLRRQPGVGGPPSEQGNSWDQVRRKPQQESRGNQRPSENYSYSESEEDRAVAKERAQRDFDAMLEAERRGER